MPLLIRTVTGLVAGALLYSAFTGTVGQLAIFGFAAVAWVFIGLVIADVWEEPS